MEEKQIDISLYNELQEKLEEKKNEKAQLARKILYVAIKYDSSSLSNEDVLKKLSIFKMKYPQKYKEAYYQIFQKINPQKASLTKNDKDMLSIFKMSDKKYLEIEYKNLYEKAINYPGGIERFKFDNPEESRRLELMKYTIDNYK